jgi:putative acetyltransferase
MRSDGLPVGCAAVKMLTDSLAELGRMFVIPPARGRGLSHIILSAIEDEARRLGATRIVLETGNRQLAAIALYTSAGYTRIPPFGVYATSPVAVCFEKHLGP